MKLCIMVSNSLKKDPRVVKQVQFAVGCGIETHFIGYEDAYLDWDFLNSLNCNVNLISLGEQYVGQLYSLVKKIKRKILLPIKTVIALRSINPTIIHANDFDMLPLAFLGSNKKNTKIIYDTHEIFAENLDMQGRKFFKRLVIILERYLIRRVDAVISVSHSAAKYLAEKYNIDVPTVITNCPYRYTGEKMPKMNDDFEVLYHGLMTRGRGYEELIESSDFIQKNIRLVLRGYGSRLEYLQALAIERENVFFEPPVEVSELVYYASRSDAGAVLTQPINLNFELTVSNKIFEYVQAGIPVIMSDLPEHRYLNEKYCFGIIVDQDKPEKIGEAIQRLATDSVLYLKLKDNAFIMAEEMCWEEESKKLIELYKR